MDFAEILATIEKHIPVDPERRNVMTRYFDKNKPIAWLDIAAAQGLAAGLLTALQYAGDDHASVKLLFRHPAGENERYRFQRDVAKEALLFLNKKYQADDLLSCPELLNKAIGLDLTSDLLFELHWCFGDLAVELGFLPA